MTATVPTAAFSIRLVVSLANVPGVLGALTTTIGEVGGNIAAASGFEAKGPIVTRTIDVHARSEEHARQIAEAAGRVEGVTLLDWWDRTFRMHEGGKVEVLPLCSVGDAEDLAMAYTPGVARICNAIAEDPRLAHRYTIKKNTVAIVTDGTAVLGLGDIGPAAAMPVMEGKALLFKEFGQVDAFPICLDVATPDEVVETVIRLAPTFGGVNLEDIAAPGAFEIEAKLREALDIPVFHDDQHGTAVVTIAALTNALELVGKKAADLSVLISGVGAAGMAIGKMLLEVGVGEIVGVDRQGAVHRDRSGLNEPKRWFAEHTNPDNKAGALSDVIEGADVFIGVSAPGILAASDLGKMAEDPIVFAMANPDPEIQPEDAEGMVAVMATGRSDYPNQINNVLAFPGIFRGALDAGATTITEGMNMAAAGAIASLVAKEDLHPSYVIPSVFDRRVAPAVATAVAKQAIDEGVVR